eukprot:jgi/Mesen1/2609/ME000166S01739
MASLTLHSCASVLIPARFSKPSTSYNVHTAVPLYRALGARGNKCHGWSISIESKAHSKNKSVVVACAPRRQCSADGNAEEIELATDFGEGPRRQSTGEGLITLLDPAEKAMDIRGKMKRRGIALLIFSAAAGLSYSFWPVPETRAGILPEFASPNQFNVLNRVGEITHTDEEWRKLLTPAEYGVLRKEGTEVPFLSPLNKEKRKGNFSCRGCGNPVFTSDSKYNSGTGWPSFYAAIPGGVDEVPDFSIIFYPRTEIRCHKCKSHLGHVFDDGPEPTGKRYCMNGVALAFQPVDSDDSSATQS